MNNQYSPNKDGRYNLPSLPISNVVDIGGTGYNGNNNMGSYYNNSYNNSYNPYFAKMQEDTRIAKEKEEQRQQSDIMKKISRKVNKASNSDIEDMDEYLKQYDTEVPDTEQQQDDETSFRLLNVHFTGTYGDPRTRQRINRHNQIFDKMRERVPNDISMYDYHTVASELYREALIEKQADKLKDLSKLYQPNAYNDLINLHSKGGPGYFSSVFGGANNKQDSVDIDDMEVSLPSHLTNEFAARKAAFLQSIFNK